MFRPPLEHEVLFCRIQWSRGSLRKHQLEGGFEGDQEIHGPLVNTKREWAYRKDMNILPFCLFRFE